MSPRCRLAILVRSDPEISETETETDTIAFIYSLGDIYVEVAGFLVGGLVCSNIQGF
jgi:hypothetical protein